MPLISWRRVRQVLRELHNRSLLEIDLFASGKKQVRRCRRLCAKSSTVESGRSTSTNVCISILFVTSSLPKCEDTRWLGVHSNQSKEEKPQLSGCALGAESGFACLLIESVSNTTTMRINGVPRLSVTFPVALLVGDVKIKRLVLILQIAFSANRTVGWRQRNRRGCKHLGWWRTSSHSRP